MDALTTTGLVVGAAGLVLFAAAYVLRRRGTDVTRTSDVPVLETAAEVRALMAQGRRVDAVRLYRERTGANLVDAARSVDRISAQADEQGR
ncbi:MAG: hypothetical protein ACRCSN_11615 [Dermatophilaceae bacterium]